MSGSVPDSNVLSHLAHAMPCTRREISRDVACRVIQMANKQGHARDGGYTASMDDDELRDWVANEMWQPTYNTFSA